MNRDVRRPFTSDVISAVEDGFLSWETVARAALKYLSEDDVIDLAEINGWNIWIEDEEDEEDDTIMKRLTPLEKQKIDEIADRYVTSSPVSGKWETEAIHERDAIAKELKLTKEEANEVMVEYLGFDIDDLEKVTAQDVIDAARKYGLTFTEEALKDLEWNVVDYINDDSEFNNADEWMKAVIDGKTEELSDLFVQDVNWKKIFNDPIVGDSITKEDLIKKARDYNLTFTREALKDIESNIIDYINDMNWTVEKWFEEITSGNTEDVSYLFEKTGAYKRFFNESITEEVCEDCGKELGKDGRCYNQECVAYDPTSQYFDENFDIEDEEDEEIYPLTDEEALNRFKKGDVLFINNNDGYTAIVPRNKLDDENAYTRIDYDFGQKLIDRYDLKLLDRNDPDYNQEIYVYEGKLDSLPLKKTFSSDTFDENFDIEFEDEEEDDGTLLNTDYDKLNFHDEGFLIGEMELHYPEVGVFDMFDNEIFVDVDLTVTVEPEFLLEYICDRNYIDREDLTVVEAQKFIDDIARTPDDYKDYLLDFYYEQAEIKAFKEVDSEPDYFSGRRYTEMKENLDEIESMLEQNDFEIDFYDGYLTGDVELYYDDLVIIGDEIPSRNPYEPSDWKEIEINYIYTADVSQSDLVDYILDRFKLDADISNKELQKYIDKVGDDNKEFLAYHDYLKEQFRERAEEQAFYERAGRDDFDGFYEE